MPGQVKVKGMQVERAPRLSHSFLLCLCIVAHPSAREQKAAWICGAARGERDLVCEEVWGDVEPHVVSPQGNVALAQAVCLHGHRSRATSPGGSYLTANWPGNF